jgi:uncharacterized protein YebE (UPF0316 family)
MTIDTLFAAPIGALLIGLLRVTDVSMAMMRMLFAVRGHRGLAASIGFVEVLIWLVAVGKALEHLNSLPHLVGYAAGFAIGNYVGVWLEGRFALGVNVVHAVIRRPGLASRATVAAQRLRGDGFAVTELEGQGLHSSVDILNVVVPRRNVPQVVKIIREEDPEAFMSVEEVRSVQGGYIRPGGRKMPFLTMGANGMPRISRTRPAASSSLL